MIILLSILSVLLLFAMIVIWRVSALRVAQGKELEARDAQIKDLLGMEEDFAKKKEELEAQTADAERRLNELRGVFQDLIKERDTWAYQARSMGGKHANAQHVLLNALYVMSKKANLAPPPELKALVDEYKADVEDLDAAPVGDPNPAIAAITGSPLGPRPFPDVRPQSNVVPLPIRPAKPA